MNVLLLASHGIAEYDDVRMFHHLGFEVFCPGGYANPAKPGETLRPALPEVPYHADLAALCDIQRAKHREEPGRYIDWAKADLHPQLIDWADVIIVHHFVREWIRDQWPRIRHKRVIWRTCGQSDPSLELDMATLRDDGLQIVRYSPAERRYFGKIGAFAGEDALIRFGKFPQDYGPWMPDGTIGFRDRNDWTQREDFGQFVGPYIANVTQNMVQRGDATGLTFYLEATKGLPAVPAGPGSKMLPGGIGELSVDAMRDYLRKARAYIYTGTTPASYTLGLIEAMLAGVPVVSIGPEDWAGPPELFEGHELVLQVFRKGPFGNAYGRPNDVEVVHDYLIELLNDADLAREASTHQGEHARALFGMDTVGPQWQRFLTPEPWAATIEKDRREQMDRASQTSPWDAVL